MLLSTNTQARIIAQLLNGQLDTPGVELAPPWSEYAAYVLRMAPDLSDVSERWRALLNEWVLYAEDAQQHKPNIDRILAYRDAPPAALPTAGDLIDTLPDLYWLWNNWIPRNLLTFVAAQPGTGKSYLLLDLCRRIARAALGHTSPDARWPDGTPIADPGPCLYVDAENTPQVMKTRLSPWSSPERGLFYYVRPDDRRIMIDISTADDRDRLLDVLFIARPALVVIDSYGAATSKGENAKEDVQSNLAFLGKIALDYNCAVVVIHHLKKRQIQLALPSGPVRLDDIRGSTHIGAMARLVLGLSWTSSPSGDLDKNGTRRLDVVKTNLGVYPDALGVSFRPHPDNDKVAQITYGPPPELPSPAPTKLEDAADWLLATLELEGPLSASELLELAKYEDISERTLYRARAALGDQVTDTIGKQTPGNKWAISGDTQ